MIKGRIRRNGPVKFWLSAHPRIDVLLATVAGVVDLIASFFHTSIGAQLTTSLLDNANWSTYMQTLSGVSAALLGFGATAIALVLAIGSGRRGQAVLAAAGRDLNSLLAHCLGSLCAITLTLAVAAGLQPSICRLAFSIGLTFLVTLMVLRIARLWYFLHRLLGVYIQDASQNRLRLEGSRKDRLVSDNIPSNLFEDPPEGVPHSAPQIPTIFNYAVLAHAIATGDQLGIFNSILKDGIFRNSESRSTGESNPLGYTAVLDLLERAALINKSDEGYGAGPKFSDIIQFKGFFTWLFAASGEVLSKGADLIQGDVDGNNFVVQRNGALIASACSDFGQHGIDPAILNLPVWTTAKTVADLGCGDGSRLIALGIRYSLRGMGIDISGDAVATAESNARTAGLERRISFLCSDVTDFPEMTEFTEPDALVSCLMGHDFWPEERCIRILRNLHSVFPNADTLILCDTVKATIAQGRSAAIPSIGYEYLHAVMGQYIPTRDEWRNVLAGGGWRLVEEHPIHIPANTLIFVLKRA